MFTVPGDGDIDFKPIIEAIYNSDYEGWIVVEAKQVSIYREPIYLCEKSKGIYIKLLKLLNKT